MSGESRPGGAALLFAFFLAGAAAGGAVAWLVLRRDRGRPAAVPDLLREGRDALARAAQAARDAFARAAGDAADGGGEG